MKNTEENSGVLNMMEKRKLETLLVGDIELASRTFTKTANDQRIELISRLEAKIPKEVQELYKLYQTSQEEARKADKMMGELGWEIRGYTDKYVGIRTYGTLPKELEEFDEKVKATKEKLSSLTRTYTIKLFGRGVEAQNLFAQLEKELAKIVL